VNLARDAWSAARSARERDAPLSDAAELDGEGGADVGWTRRVTSPELLAIQGDRESRLRDAFTRLAESDRRLVAAMLVEGRDGRDVARELGIDRQAVYQRLHRAKEKLRRILGEAGSGGGTRTAARPSVPAAQGAAP
jgi:RNA polymerase sigma factor (sigma-70 family)